MVESKKSRIDKDAKNREIKSTSSKKSLFADPEEMEEGINKIMGIIDGKK